MLNENISIVRLHDFFQKAADLHIPVDNSKVFKPEPSWSKTFGRGLEALNFGACNVVEVGVGSGVNMAGLITCAKPPLSFVGVDLVDDAVSASQALADREGWDVRLFQSDLLENVGAGILRHATDIIACIPQVPRKKDAIHSGRELSDYYEETGIKEDTYGLGLIARLLDQVAERARHADLILNIAERPGKDRVDEMFANHGFSQEIIHKERVPQDPTTNLESLAEIERTTGLPFHFYADPKSSTEIGAVEAEALRVQGKPIFHNLSVLRAHLR